MLLEIGRVKFVHPNLKDMKKIIIPAAILIAATTANAQLNYTQVTTGLNAVSFEGGDSEVELGDIDGDGDLDIVSIGDHGSPNVNVTEAGIMVWKNNGTGTAWSFSKYGNLGYGGVALGDVNDDGKMDVAMGMHHNYATSGLGSQMLEVALGDGSGSNWTQYSNGLLGNGNWGMFAPDFGDVNNDGKLDIVCTPFSYDDGLRVYTNSGSNNWVSKQAMATGNIVNYNCKLGDFDNDGNLDLMVACQAGSAMRGNGQGTFSSMKTGLPNDWTMKFAIGDLDNNGSKDLAIVSSGAITTYKYSGGSWQTFGNTNLPASGAKYVALADMDMDGFCDLLAFMGTGIEIYKGDGTGNWTLNGNIPLTISYVRGLAINDLDHDGFSDIVYFGSSGGSNSLKVFLHNIDNPSLNVLPEFPKGNECLKPGSVHFAKWLASVPSGSNATMMIEFSSTGNGGPWTTVAASAPNSGVFQWVVPNVTSPNCHLRYTVTQGSNSQSVVTNAFGVGSCLAISTNDITTQIQDLHVYPNPVGGNDMLHVTLPSSEQATISLLDIFGRVIASYQVDAGLDQFEFATKQISQGLYICRYESETLRSESRVVISR